METIKNLSVYRDTRRFAPIFCFDYRFRSLLNSEARTELTRYFEFEIPEMCGTLLNQVSKL